MRARLRTVTIGGVPRQMTTRDAARFDVVRKILVGGLRIDQGARRLRMKVGDLARLVDGARAAVVRELGEQALEQARVDDLA